MKTLFALSIVFWTVCVADSVAAQDVKDLAGFAQLAGCWERTDPAGSLHVTEIWMKPAGTSMLGMGRTVRGGKTSDFEFMRIEIREKDLFFIAKPAANTEETAFKLKKLSPGEAVFENLQHDFPQRIIYKFNADSMIGRIEGNNKGKPMGIDFPFNRVKCE